MVSAITLGSCNKDNLSSPSLKSSDDNLDILAIDSSEDDGSGNQKTPNASTFSVGQISSYDPNTITGLIQDLHSNNVVAFVNYKKIDVIMGAIYNIRYHTVNTPHGGVVNVVLLDKIP